MAFAGCDDFTEISLGWSFFIVIRMPKTRETTADLLQVLLFQIFSARYSLGDMPFSAWQTR